MEWLLFVVAVLLALVGIPCLVVTALGGPGIWLLIGMALLVEWADHWYLGPGQTTFEWGVVIACLLLAGLGEILEWVGGIAGAATGGASRRGLVGALIGGILGGILGAIVLTPLIPIALAGLLVGAVAGTFLGALIGELSAPRSPTVKESLRPAAGAALGRVLGAMGKTSAGLVVWILLVVSAFWP